MLLICPLVIVSPCSQNNKFLFIALSVCCHYCGLFILPEGCFVSYFWKAIQHICSGFIGLNWFIIFWHIQCSRCKFNEKRIRIQLWTSSHSGKYCLLLTPCPFYTENTNSAQEHRLISVCLCSKVVIFFMHIKKCIIPPVPAGFSENKNLCDSEPRSSAL